MEGENKKRPGAESSAQDKPEQILSRKARETLDKQGKKIVGQVRVENAHISQSVESTPSRACVYARTDSSVAWSCVR